METIILYRNVTGDKEVVNRVLPAGRDTFSFQGEFRQITNITEPVIDLEFGSIDLTSLFKFNYVYIPRLERYYWLRRFEFVSSKICRLYLHEDYYNTWSVLIENMYCVVSRNEQGEPSRLQDSKVLCSAEPIIDYVNASDPITLQRTSETDAFCFVVTFACPPLRWGRTTTTDDFKVSKATAGNVYSRSYLMSFDALTEFCDKCWGESQNVADFFNSFFTDFSEGVINVVMLPFRINNVIQNFYTQTVINGVNTEFIDATKECNGTIYIGSKTITLDKNPNEVRIIMGMQTLEFKPFVLDFKNYYNSFLDYSGYTEIKMYLPYLGFVDVDVDLVMGKKAYVQYKVDYITCNATIELQVDTDTIDPDYGNKRTIAIYNTTIGTSISLSRTNITDRRNQMLQAGIKAAGGIAGAKFGYNSGLASATNPGNTDPDALYKLGNTTKANAASIATNFAIDMVRANRERISGGQSSNEYVWNFARQQVYAIITRPKVLDSLYEKVENSDYPSPNVVYRYLYGLPVMVTGTLKQLSDKYYGYTELGEFHLPMVYVDEDNHFWSMTEEEWAMLNNLLGNGGFHYTKKT